MTYGDDSFIGEFKESIKKLTITQKEKQLKKYKKHLKVLSSLLHTSRKKSK